MNEPKAATIRVNFLEIPFGFLNFIMQLRA